MGPGRALELTANAIVDFLLDGLPDGIYNQLTAQQLRHREVPGDMWPDVVHARLAPLVTVK